MIDAKDYFYEAVVCAVIAQVYESQGLVGNAHWFAVRSVRAIAKGLKALAMTAKAT